ncbi:FAS1 domain-containing protein SELMODRAFT_448915-like [Diospyros lotus]|uniref:FAS1 domain-containing protein SELMODRAFT_448915-like n=1 Tax=Diospyros lotus TaxID=55363 RepID=UPI0022521A7C|nr:FAS1 domain-containing protein SELMODRAFT_448915-like [Diospyros lotus]
MANWLSLHLLVAILTITMATLAATSTAKSPQPPPAAGIWDEIIKNITDVLTNAGDFGIWADLLSAAASSNLPLSATLFVPSDDALSHLATIISFDPFIIPYHIVPQRLSFSDLQLFQTRARIPTLLPSNSILITNNSRFNFTIDASPITRPDLYANSDVCVHGLKTILDYSIYGAESNFFAPPPPSAPETVAPPSGEDDAMGWRLSNAPAGCLCAEFPIMVAFLIVRAAFSFKILGFLGACR